MFTKNTDRQLQPNRSAPVRMPPSSKPMAEAKPRTAPYRPNAWPRSLAEKTVRKVASSCGVITAAAAPWTTRAAISSPGAWASPAARLAAPNSTIPVRNSGGQDDAGTVPQLSQDDPSRYLASLPPGQFPNLTALAGHFSSVDPDERFELLLDIFVDGLAQRAGAR